MPDLHFRVEGADVVPFAVAPTLSLSLHVYGHHINHTDRWQFDADRRTATPWKVRES